ncbi:MAG TPA: glycoside hydrolase family 47 protein [Pyrinomonadaceae bacterium]|nr:glycoside hydrolase family 47 protein [Pyrinomonadaceae bacterium]
MTITIKLISIKDRFGVRALSAVFFILLLSTTAPTFAQQRTQLQNQVRAEFVHAWNGYKKYAWGHDDLKPLSKTYHDWYAEPLLMTPVDALDTMILMGLKDDARSTREYIAAHLSFDKDISVQNFEITIRLLGGLLSSYQMTGDRRLLNLAEDLGNRLLPVFESPTGLPYRYVNLKTGKVRGEVTNPAEAGTLMIEFGTLAKLTNRRIFYDKAKRALVETYKRRSPIGLVGTWINVETGQWTNTDSHISGAIDSYYEYLLKCAILFGDQDCRKMWEDSIAAINQYLRDEKKEPAKPELWYGHADMNSGKRTETTYGALDAFFPAVLALSGDLNRASLLQDSSYKMWMKHSIEPEEIDYSTIEVKSAGYPLRPEIIESTYYLYHYATAGTRASRAQAAAKLDAKHYQQMGAMMWRDFVRYCRTGEGYAALKSVVTKEQSDSMQSFLFAETFKYFYLLFAPARTLDFDKFIFNTEAHPIRRQWPQKTKAVRT